MSSIQLLAMKDVWLLFSLGNVFLTLLLVLIVTFAYSVVHNHFFHPLSKFPGPFWAGATRLWGVYHSIKGDVYLNDYEQTKKYGPVVRISPSLLLIRDATMLPEVYHRHSNKSGFYFKNMLGKAESVVSIRDWREHGVLRKVSGGAYAFSNLKKMEPIFDANISRWTNKLHDSFAATRRDFDFAPWAAYMTNDVLSDVGFGDSFGFVSQGKDVENLIEDFRAGLPALGVMTNLYPLINWIRSTRLGARYTFVSPDDKKGWGRVMKFRDRLINQRRNDISAGKHREQTDFLQTFIDARDDDGHPLDEEQIKAELLFILLAGADTTGTAMSSAMHFIVNTPEVYEKLLAEITEVEKQGTPPGVPAFDEVLRKYPYFVACVKESLRLRPSAVSIFPRIVRKGGMSVGSLFIPEGSEVSCQAWIANRDPSVYGPDATEYRPERWLESEEKTRLYEKHSFTFGYGTRACLGKDIALMELYKGLLHFFRVFNVKGVDTRRPPVLKSSGTVMIWSDIWLNISPRQSMATEDI